MYFPHTPCLLELSRTSPRRRCKSFVSALICITEEANALLAPETTSLSRAVTTAWSVILGFPSTVKLSVPSLVAYAGLMERYAQITSYTEMDEWETVVKALGMPSEANLAAVLQKFYDAAHREPVYQGFYHEEDGSITPYEGLFF